MPPTFVKPPLSEMPAEIWSKLLSTTLPNQPPKLMKRHIPGLHRESRISEERLEGVFLVRVDRAFFLWHPQRPFYVLGLTILEPGEHQGRSISGRLYCTPKAIWK